MDKNNKKHFYPLVFYIYVLMFNIGTVFQTAAYFLFVIPRLRPGLLSLRSVLPSRQILQKRLSVSSVESVVRLK